MQWNPLFLSLALTNKIVAIIIIYVNVCFLPCVSHMEAVGNMAGKSFLDCLFCQQVSRRAIWLFLERQCHRRSLFLLLWTRATTL